MRFDARAETMDDRAWAEADSAPSSVADPEVQLAEARARLQASLGALQVRLDELRDWRAWMRRHPLPFLLGAFGLGTVVGLLGWRGRLDLD
jgi:hypothetical protein